MISQKLFERINQAIDDRNGWEQKQLDWNRLRYEGYGRPTLPYPDAPDMHYPLVDIEIEKLKPYYIQQIFGQDRLASFIDLTVGENPAVAQSNSIIAEDELRFDLELKQRSNFERASHNFVDKACHKGICVVKQIFKDNELQFIPIDPIHIIVPIWTADLDHAEWLVHVIRISEGQFRANPKFVQDEATIDKIKGRGKQSKSLEDQQEQEIKMREGITGSEDNETIVLWEVYWKKNPSDKQWTITTMSPLAGIDTEITVAGDVKLPYNVGCFAEGAHPFSEITYEAATNGFYSARGVAEILEPFELDLCKSWNYKLQFLDFNGNPTYFVSDPTANMMNFDTSPGSCRPFGIQKDEPINAPTDLNEAMQLTRSLAEDRISIPDFSNGYHIPGQSATTQKGQVTATQIRALVGQSGQGNDLRAKLFKNQLGRMFRKSWDIICQYRKIQARKALIVPSGSADAWNKENKAQRFLGLFQVLQNRPNVNQDELVKLLLEQESPELVKRLFRDSGQAANDNAKKQADEFGMMLNGFTPTIDPDDDDITHLEVLAQMTNRRLKKGEPVDPELATRLLAHGAQHEQQAQAKKDPRLQQTLMQFAPLVAILEQIAQHPTQPPAEPPPGTPDGTQFQ